MNSGSTIDRARGRWREILPRLGIETRYLRNKHGPCPLCGGKDRFRFDDRDGSGSYFCNQCGAGSGIILVQKRHGWDFATAASEIDKIIGTEPPQPVARADDRRDERPDRRARIERVLNEARDHALVERYLASRGLSTFPGVLRGHPRLPYYDGEGRFAGKHPAILAPVIGPDGSLQAIHRTYLADVLPRKKLTPPVETVTGAVVRLFAPGDHLGIAEGIETTLAAYELFGFPTWAVLSATIMEGWTPPEDVKRVTIFADNDASFAGQKAAYGLANRLVVRHSLEVDVMVPNAHDTDWLDVLIGRKSAA